MGGVLALLAVASLIGAFLRFKVRTEQGRTVVDNLNGRIRAWWVMVTIFGSPSKTVEGFLGGAISAALIGAAMYWITPFSPVQALGMSLVIVVMGFLGGLALSAVKRSLGVKDWGSMIEGHGGMLDRVDSLSFAAPIFFHLTRYYFTP